MLLLYIEIACVSMTFFSINTCYVSSRQKRNFRKHRKYLKSLTLTYKKSYHHYGQGNITSIQGVHIPFKKSRTEKSLLLSLLLGMLKVIQEKCSISVILGNSYLPHMVGCWTLGLWLVWWRNCILDLVYFALIHLNLNNNLRLVAILLTAKF